MYKTHERLYQPDSFDSIGTETLTLATGCMAFRSRQATFQKIQQMDAEEDAIAICHLLAGYEFPWDTTRALEISLLRTFCVPSIAKLLDRTGEFHHHAQKRYDDTGIIVSELFKWGYHHPRGQAFLQRMNTIHQR